MCKAIRSLKNWLMDSVDKNREELWDRIERYLRDELTAEERTAFEAEMAADPELKNEVELHRMVHDTLGDPAEHAFRQTLGDVATEFHAKQRTQSKTRRLNPNWRIVSMAASVLLLVGVFAWLNTRQSAGGFDSFEPYAMVLTQRSQADTAAMDVLITRAVQQYESEEYQAAATSFAQLKAMDPSAVSFAFYEGVSRLAVEQYDEAIAIFRQVLDTPDHLLIEQSRWYLGLALWKSGDEDGAREVFQAIGAGEFNYSKAQKLLN